MAENEEPIGNEPLQDDAAGAPEDESIENAFKSRSKSEEKSTDESSDESSDESPSAEEQAMLEDLEGGAGDTDAVSAEEQAMLDDLEGGDSASSSAPAENENAKGDADEEVSAEEQAMIDSLMGEGDSAEGHVSDEEQAMLAQLGMGEDDLIEPVEISAIELPTVEPSPEKRTADDTEDENLKMILDIPVDVHVEVGTTRAAIRDILKLGSGSVVELDRLAGQPADVIANGKLIAWGDVVIVNESFGVRITKILRPEERIEGI